MVTVPSDYDSEPERYRLGMQVTRAYSTASLYELVATMLAELDLGLVLDVGCGEGALREFLPASHSQLMGIDRSATMLRAHPPPVVRADALRLPIRSGVADAVTAINVFYHLPDPNARPR